MDINGRVSGSAPGKKIMKQRCNDSLEWGSKRPQRRFGGRAAWLRIALTVLLGACGLQIGAEDRALVVGIGEYQSDSVPDLPGIDLDLDMMRDVARWLGYSSDQIKILRDEQATLGSFRQKFREWLHAKEADGRILVYFSGHGSHVADDDGDENDDGQDEVLVLHDSGFANGRLQNVLRDDEFGKLLGAIPSRDVLVLIDACHSGSATKSFRAIGEGAGQAKYLPNPAAAFDAGAAKDIRARSFAPTERGTHVLLSAAADNELAQATNKGSAFTLGVREAVAAAGNRRSLTLEDLKQEVATYIAEVVSPGDLHTPQLSGRDELVRRNLFFGTAGGRGPIRDQLERLIDGLTPMTVTATESTYRLGQHIQLTVDIPTDGYLNIVNVGATDAAVVLYPNKYHRNNQVSAGRLTLPTEEMDFDLTAVEPRGESITVAFLSKKPINVYEDTVKGRDRDGRVVATLAALSAKGGASLRSIAVEGNDSSGSGRSYGGKVVVKVVR